MTFDLGDYDFDPQPAVLTPAPVDTSGRPRPTQAFLVTADGYRIVADIAYDGIDSDTGDRRYALKVESDWLSMRLTACEIDRHPDDVAIMFKTPGDFDQGRRDQLYEMLARIAWVVGSQTTGKQISFRRSDP